MYPGLSVRIFLIWEDSLCHVAVFIFVTDYDADVFAFLQRVVTLEDEALVFVFNEGEAAGDAGKNCAHASTNDLSESIGEQNVPLIERGVLRDGKDNGGAVPA